MSGALLFASFGVPLALLAACLSRRARARMPGWLWLAPLPALATALFADGAFVVDPTGIRLTLALDRYAATLLGVAALLWSGAGLYAHRYLHGDPRATRFAEWWLATLAGSLGVFVAADLLSFYIAFALVSLPAWGLVIHDGTPAARRAGSLYLGLAVLGEICLLLAFALLADRVPGSTIALADVVPALPAARGRDLVIALLVAGFGLKMGLVPLHVWLPIAHPAAPMPASAVLSGAITKAGVIGLVRFLPFDAALAHWGLALAVIGLLTAYYAVAVGVTQANPKTLLAYSTASQLGGVAAIFGMGLATLDDGAVAAATFAAAHHLLVKGALFLAVGVVATTPARRARSSLTLAAVLSLSLAGLPLTGGALAKLAAKAPLGDGAAGALATLSAAGTAFLMLTFWLRLRGSAGSAGEPSTSAGLTAPWLAMAAAALAVPWALAPTLVGVTGADVLAPKALWESSWPIALGAALAVALRLFGPLPSVPPGDLVVLGAPLARIGGAASDALDRVDTRLREWPAASVALLALAAALGAALITGR